MLTEREYIVKVRHFYYEPSVAQTIVSILPYSLVLVALRIFAVTTYRLR